MTEESRKSRGLGRWALGNLLVLSDLHSNLSALNLKFICFLRFVFWSFLDQSSAIKIRIWVFGEETY